MVAPNRRRHRARHLTWTASAPVGGLNVRDPIDAMVPTDALELINWIPQQFGVRARKGYRIWNQFVASRKIRTLMQYQPNREDPALFRLFAVADDGIFDVTTSGTTSSAFSFASFPFQEGRGRFTHTLYSNSAGNFLLACSHIGGYFYYNGSSWVKAGTGQITGIDPDNLVFVTAWKRRLWFIEKDSTSAWYSDVDAITGSLTEFNLGPFVKRGGKLSFIANWTIDAGEGIDDFIVFGFENGDVLIYKGTDPASSSTFSIVGAYYVGAIVKGRRSFVGFGGDILIMSELGIQPLSYVTRGAQSLFRVSSTDYLGKIQPRFAELMGQYSDQDGWDMIVHPRENLLIVNLPQDASTDSQYALYTNTNAWTFFRGMPMRCFTIANNQLYFGTDDGKVCLAFEDYFDNVAIDADVGDPITGVVQPVYSYFGRPSSYKHFLMIRPSFLASGRPSLGIQMLVDYQTPNSFTIDAPVGTSNAQWDLAKWDAAKWAGPLSRYGDWVSAEALGYTGSPYISTVCIGDTFLVSLDYLFESGGVI